MSTEHDSAIAPTGLAPTTGAYSAPANAQESHQTSSSRLLRVVSPPVVALLVIVLVGGALTFMHLAAPILNPVILSVFIVTLTLPAYQSLQRRGVKKIFALLILAGVVLLFGVGVVLLAWLSVSRLQEGLSQYSQNIDAAVSSLTAKLGAQASTASGSGAAKALAAIVAAIANSIGYLLVSFLLAIFLLVEAPRFGKLLNTSMAEVPFLGMTPQVMNTAIKYFVIRFRLNLITGIGFALFLWLVGVPYAPLWGTITVLLSFVPYIGLVIAAIPPVLLAFAEYGWERALLVIVGVTVINFAVENIASPSLMGRGLKLSPSVVFVSFLFWMWLMGPLGAIIAMPLDVLLMMTFNKYESTRWVAQIIGEIG